MDFYCHKAKLAVELDGSQHYEVSGMQKDTDRTAWLQSQGIAVIRFSNLDVMRRFRSVCEAIDLAVQEHTSGVR